MYPQKGIALFVLVLNNQEHPEIELDADTYFETTYNRLKGGRKQFLLQSEYSHGIEYFIQGQKKVRNLYFGHSNASTTTFSKQRNFYSRNLDKQKDLQPWRDSITNNFSFETLNNL